MNRPSIYALATALVAGTAQAAPLPSTNATTTYHRVQVDGVGIFYREAGPRDAPTIVLLHGFPSSSREFDTVIPLLATKYHLIAPDYPGFGLSDAPSPVDYTYTFDHLAKTMRDLLETLKVRYYTMYLHDYGAPIGFRIALAHTGQLHALIIQNGNIYRAGLGPKWAKIAEYWADPNAHPEVLSAFLSFEATKVRHLAGTSHPGSIRSGYLDKRVRRSFAPRSARDSSGPALRLQDKRCVLPKMAVMASLPPASDSRGLGRERPFIHRSGCGSL